MKSFQEETKKKEKEKKLLSEAIFKAWMEKRVKSMREQEKSTLKKSHFLTRFRLRRSSESHAQAGAKAHFADLKDPNPRPRSREVALRYWKRPEPRHHHAERQPQSPALLLRKSAMEQLRSAN